MFTAVPTSSGSRIIDTTTGEEQPWTPPLYTAWSDGCKAVLRGQTENPHPENSAERLCWSMGLQHWQDTAAEGGDAAKRLRRSIQRAIRRSDGPR